MTIEAYQLGNSVYDGAANRVSVSVNPEILTVAADNTAVTYGGAVPALTYAPINVAVNDGHVEITGAPSLSATATSKSPAGMYPIQISPGTLAAQYNPSVAIALSDPNYTFAFKDGTLTIKKAELTVAAGNYTIHQGQRIEPELKYTITGFVNGDSRSTAVRGNPELVTKARIDSPPGTYPIVVKPGSLTARNYSFKKVDGSITIVK